MDEKLTALQFYRVVRRALKTDGVNGVIIFLNEDKEMEAHIVPMEKEDVVQRKVAK